MNKDNTPEQIREEPQAAVPRCIDMPNDVAEGHYWAYAHQPGSIPEDFRHCRTCGRIDASEAIQVLITEAVKEVLEHIEDMAYTISRDAEITPREYAEDLANVILEEKAKLDKGGE